MLIRITSPFKGLAPSLNPAILLDSMAQVAMNCHLGWGAITPLRGVTAVATPSKGGSVQSIYPFASRWLNWISDVDVCQSAIAGDSWDRLYFTGGASFVPQYTVPSLATAGGDYPSGSYRLGLPAPTGAVVGVVDGDITEIDPTLVENRVYAVTFVSAYGEEGPPSPVSAQMTVAPGQHVDLSGLPGAPPVGAYNVSHVRIYRTNTGSAGTDYQCVTTLPVTTTGYADSVASADLGSVMVSATWDAPPSALHGLISLPCGSMAGISGNELCFSEPYQPHAWPVEYRLSFDSDLVAIGAYGNSILVATQGSPYVVTGSHPSSMGMERLEEGSACVSKRGLVDMGYAVIWPAQNGLMMAGMGAVKLLTAGLIHQRDWAALVPSTIHAYLWDKKYVAFWSNGSGANGFIFDPVTGDLVFHTIAATAGYHDPLTGTLYLVVGGSLVTWDSGSALTATWRSKRFNLAMPVNLACAQVVAESYPLTAKIYADGVLKLTQTVASANPFRLPGGFLPGSYEIEIVTTGVVSMVALATSMKELAGV